MVLLIKIPIGLARGIRGIIACPDPVSIQLAAGVDDLGYGLATGSAATREGTRGFLPRRTFCLRPGCGTRPLAWIPTGGTSGAPTCTTMSEADLVRDFEQARRRQQAMWAAGDYTRVAEQLTRVSAAVVEATASPHRRREASDHSS